MKAITMHVDGTAHHSFHKPKLDYLKELSGGDQQFMTEIMEMFITEAPQAMSQAHEHLRQNNFESVRATIHKLKSSVQVVGGFHLAGLMQEIEAAAKEGASDLWQKLAHLEQGIHHMITHLSEELAVMSTEKGAA